MAEITFIGLGNMGLPMAKNLLKANHNVFGFDLVESQMKQFLEAGGQEDDDENAVDDDDDNDDDGGDDGDDGDCDDGGDDGGDDD